MANQLTISEMIQIGDVSGPLAALYTDKKKLFGGTVIKPVPPLQITIITDVLRWGYDGGAETDATLRKIANYGYWMWGKFEMQARNIISGPGGGSVVSSSSGVSVDDLDFIVDSTSYIATGQTSVTFDGTNGKPDLRGYNIDFFRSGQPMYTTTPPDGRLYYSWNKVTGQFQLLSTDPLVNASAQALEQFRISPDSTGGTSSSTTSTSWRRLVITSGAFQPDGVTCNLATIVGSTYTLTVIGFNQEPQFAGVFFNYTANGFIVIQAGFNAANFGNIIIDKID